MGYFDEDAITLVGTKNLDAVRRYCFCCCLRGVRPPVPIELSLELWRYVGQKVHQALLRSDAAKAVALPGCKAVPIVYVAAYLVIGHLRLSPVVVWCKGGGLPVRSDGRDTAPAYEHRRTPGQGVAFGRPNRVLRMSFRSER